VECRCDAWAAQLKLLVPDMSRERDGAEEPGKESPRDSHLIGRNRTGKSAEYQAYCEVQAAQE
jgi:hypothetical protein